MAAREGNTSILTRIDLWPVAFVLDAMECIFYAGISLDIVLLFSEYSPFLQAEFGILGEEK